MILTRNMCNEITLFKQLNSKNVSTQTNQTNNHNSKMMNLCDMMEEYIRQTCYIDNKNKIHYDMNEDNDSDYIYSSESDDDTESYIESDDETCDTDDQEEDDDDDSDKCDTDDQEDDDDTDDQEDDDDYESNDIFKKLGIQNDQNIVICINKDRNEKRKRTSEVAEENNDEDTIIQTYKNKLSRREKDFFMTLEKNKQLNHINHINDINKIGCNEPMLFKIIDSNIDLQTKAIALKKCKQLNSMGTSNSEYHKLYNWVYSMTQIPFGIYKELPVNYKSDSSDVKSFIKNVNTNMNDNVYGHEKAKDQIVRIIAQWISNPNSKGNVIGIHGNPGVGKTTLIKDGLSKSLDIPFAFIPLGGATDGSFLDGHNYTYEGSIWGKIVDCLMKSKCMNPILYFDELDKISNTSRGDELINILIHLTDPSQNDKFCDKYFSDIPIDLSKCLIVFTYNDDNLINPILKDRLIRINTKDYTNTDKEKLFTDYLLPNMLLQFNIKNTDIKFEKEEIIYIIEKTDKEYGVRNLKRSIEAIVSNVNLNILLEKEGFNYPIKVTKKIIDDYININPDNSMNIISHMYM